MPETLLIDEVFDSHLEVRSAEERLISGRIIPYNERIMIGGKPESFAKGAIEGISARDITLFYNHDHRVGQFPIGYAVSLEERDDGAYATFKVAGTPKGDEALQLAVDGVLKNFSPGFVEAIRTAQGVIRKLKSLPEVSLTPFPAYKGAVVMSVRDKEIGMDPESNGGVATDEQIETRTAEVDLSPVLDQVEDLKVRMEKLSTAFDLAKTGGGNQYVDIPTPAQWFAAELRSQFFNDHKLKERLNERWDNVVVQYRAGNLDELQTRALSDVTAVYPASTPADDLGDLVRPVLLSAQLVSILDRRRPFFSNVGSIDMPRSGVADIPRITQHAEVAARGAQKSEIPSQAVIIDLDQYVAGWLAGGVDIAIEALRTADLDVFNLVWEDLVGLYAQATEHDTTHGIVPKVDAGITGAAYTGAVIAVDTYAAFIAAVLAAADTVEDNSGAPATRLFLPRAAFNAVIGLINPTVLTATGDGGGATIDLTSQSFVIPGTGIRVFKVKGLDQAILTNTESFKTADSGPEQVTATNVALMGRDLGLLGRTLVVPRIPGGIVYFEVAPS